jgi:DNA-binding NarL/FixJ family response regulator
MTMFIRGNLPSIGILIVDDHPAILSALSQLPQLDRPVTVYGAADRDETHAMLAAHPDIALVLLALALPGTRGLETLGRLRGDFPCLPIGPVGDARLSFVTPFDVLRTSYEGLSARYSELRTAPP